MANCNNTVEFIKEKVRMCNIFNCSACPFNKNGYHGCGHVMTNHPEEAVKIVQKWSDENPVKTIMMDFFEKFPNAPKEEDGTPKNCAYYLGYVTADYFFKCNSGSCEKCWNRPLEIVDKTN